MKRTKLPALTACLALICTLSAMAQDKDYWRAAGSTAKAITGDIMISDTRLSINYLGFTVAHIRDLKGPELSAVFVEQSDQGGSGNLYRLVVPARQRFLHKNTLCGSEDTQWMVTHVAGRDMQVAFFSGPDMPVLTPEALSNSTDLCGVFTYSR